MAAIWLAALPAGAASQEQVQVTLEVPSVTVLDIDGCLPGTADVTDLGTVIPDIAVRTEDDCELLFGATGTAATLKLYQEDGIGSAMGGRASNDTPWDEIDTGLGKHLRAVTMLPDGRIWVSGYDGALGYSADGGDTWTPQTSTVPAGASIRDMHALDANVVWAAAWNENVIRTLDGGQTWENVGNKPPFMVSEDLRGVRALDANRAWVAGQAGNVYYTADGGASWAHQPTAATTALWGLDLVDDDLLWAVGGQFAITHSDDGGATWSLQHHDAGAPNDDAHKLNRIDAFDADFLVAAGASGTVMKTEDGGDNWVVVPTPTTNDLDGLTLFSREHWIIVGYNNTVIETRDGGASWDELNTTGGVTTNWRGFWSPDAVSMIAVGNNGKVLRAPMDEIADYGAAAGADFATADGGFFGACLRVADQGADASAGTWTVDAGCPMEDGAWWHALPATNGDPGAIVASTAGPITVSTPARVQLRYGLRAPMGTTVGTIRARLIATVEAP